MIGYLGPEGSYSYFAGATFYVKEDLVPYNNIGRLFYALEQEEVDGIVVPLETMKFGTSFDVLGRIHHNHYHITRVIMLDIVLHVISSGTTPSTLQTIYATEESINEAYNTLKQELGKYEKHYVSSNKAAYEALEQSHENTVGAVLSNQEMLGHYNVVVNNIRDTNENMHKFILVEKSLKVTGFHNRTLIACCPKFNHVGALYDVLHEFVIRGINIVKILSLPTISTQKEMIFYIELEGNIEHETISEALAMVRYKSSFITILGSYYEK